MALSKTIHQSGRTRFARLSLAILEKLTPLLQDILLNEISPNQIYFEVSNDKSLCKKLRGEQMLLIHNAQNDGYKDFDITLLYTLLRNLKCLKVTAPTQGWGASQMPGNGETTLGDDIERIRLIRNTVVAHTAAPSLSKTESKKHWTEIAGIGKRMENLLGKIYLPSLMISELRTIDTKMESIYLEKIKELVDAEKSTKELLQNVIKGDGAYCVEEKVTVEANDQQKRKLTENFTDTSISIWKDMNCIVETTSDSEIEEQYKSIEEFVGENDDDSSKLASSPVLKRLEQKTKEYSCLGKNCMQILTRHIRFLLKLKIIYGAEVEVSKGSFLLTFTFSSRRGYGLFRQDFQRGEIEKLILEVLVDPPCLANFDLQVEDLTVHLIDDTAETHVSLSHKPGFSAKQISSITVPGVNGVFHICVVTSDRLWVSDKDRRLLQVDSTGHVLHGKLRGRTASWSTGSHTVTEDGDLLFMDNDEVCKLTSDGTVTTLLTTDRGARCIHSSRINGDILVGSFGGTMTRYDRTGRELQVIERDDKGQILYRSPSYITENRNGDIWTSDLGKHAVVALDKSGRHRFDYTGRQSDYTGRQSLFYPFGICTDVLGHVLVCDYNGSIHLLDQDGQFLSLLLTHEQHGIHSPTALCVDDQHNLYLGQDDNDTINVYKYLQVTDVK